MVDAETTARAVSEDEEALKESHKSEKKHKKEKKHKRHKEKHKGKHKAKDRSRSPTQADRGTHEHTNRGEKEENARESGEIEVLPSPAGEVQSNPEAAAATEAQSSGAKHKPDRAEDAGPRKKHRGDGKSEKHRDDDSSRRAEEGPTDAGLNGTSRHREDERGRHASDAHHRAERSPSSSRHSGRAQEDARRNRDGRRHDSRPPRDDARGGRDSGRPPSRARDDSRSAREFARPPSRPRDDSRGSRDPYRHHSRPRDDSRGARDLTRARDDSRRRSRPPRSPEPRRRPSRERRPEAERGPPSGDRKRRRSAEKEDEEFAAKVIAKLEEGAEDEDALIEERRRRRQELLARLQQEQALTSAAVNPTATEVAGKAASEGPSVATPPREAGDAPPPASAAQPVDEPAAPHPPTPARPSAADPQGGVESETEDEESLEETTEEQLFQQRKGDAADGERHTPPPTESEERHKIRAQQAEFDMFAAEPVEDMFADAPVAAPAPAAGAPRRGLLDNYDDSEGYYNFQVGELMGERYEVFATHGKGVFSTVLRARDLKPTDEAGRPLAVEGGAPPEVAIKVIRANDLMSKAGQTEVVILRKLAGADPANKYHTIRLLSTFTYRNHLCLVFEPLESNLRQLTKKYGQGIGLRLDAVRSMAAQMLMALHLMRQCGVLHADIKPDNILINKGHNVIKMCDFGSAMFTGNNEITPYLVSRFYRAPEIILGLHYDHPMDVWSVGCVIYELFTGRILFPGRTNNEMLKLMMDVKGPFPKKMLKKGEFAAQHFEDDPAASFCLMELDPLTKRPTKRLIANPTIKKDFKALLAGQEGEPRQVANLVDLLEKMMALDPDKRITAKEALRHPFVRDGRAPPKHRAGGPQ